MRNREKHPQIVEFAKTLYNSEKRFMISKEMLPQANEISMQGLSEWLENMAKPWKYRLFRSSKLFGQRTLQYGYLL